MASSCKLTDFSLNESFMILNSANTSYSKFIKFSLIELINLKVLETYRASAGIKEFPNLKYTYIKRGECYFSISTKNYFNTFTETFLKKDKNIPLHIFGRNIFTKVNWNDFKDKLVYKNLVDQGIYVDTFLTYFSIYILSKKGRFLKKLLKQKLKTLDKAIDKKDSGMLAKISDELGLNIFLSEKINSKTLQELSFALKLIPNSQHYFDSIFVSYYDFGKFSSFDSSFDSFDFGGGDFGGGGDSGSWD